MTSSSSDASGQGLFLPTPLTSASEMLTGLPLMQRQFPPGAETRDPRLAVPASDLGHRWARGGVSCPVCEEVASSGFSF